MEGACTSGCTRTCTLDGMYDSGMTRYTTLIFILYIDEYTVKTGVIRRREQHIVTKTEHTG